MRFIPFLALSFFISVLQAQPLPILEDEYTWSDTEDYHAMVPDKVTGDAHILLDDRTLEYNYAADGNLYSYYFIHKVVYLNSEQGVEEQNKIYVSLENALELLDYNARVISADGQVTLLGKDALQSGVTEDERTFNYFAIAGAEVGSIVEYYYLLKRQPNFSGSYMVLQGSYPIQKSQFRIVSPTNLVFEAFAVNGYNEVEKDTTYEDRLVLKAHMENVPKAPNDPSANNLGSTMKVIYQLDDNLFTGNTNIYNYGTLSQSIFEILRGKASKKTKKKIAKFLKSADFDFAGDQRDKIFQIENFLKENIRVVEGPEELLTNLEFILENKVANEYGMNTLFFHALRHYEIPFEVVLTSNRFNLRFEEDIESYAFLSDYLFYFPEIDDYTMAGATAYRLGVIPFGYIHNHGLFIKELDIAGIVTGVGKVKFIEAYDDAHSHHDMWLDVTFNDDLSNINVDLKEERTGYNATPFQPFFDYVPEERLGEFRESIVKMIHEDIEVEEVTTENSGDENLMKHPFIVNSTFSSDQFIELAGNKVLFKVGELIGPQLEMYQEEKRTLPVETNYNHRYYREINFLIPDGYACKNLSDINLDVRPFEEQDKAAGFVSSFEQEGNEVKVMVEEYYKRIDFSLQEFEDYRSVINAAADFNKIVLVLEEI